MLSPHALKAAEDALWEFFKEHLATSHFSYRNDYDNEISATKPTPCLPGDELTAIAPKTTPEPIHSIWVVYCNKDAEEIISACLAQGRLNGHHAKAFVPRRENITFRQ